MKIVKTKLDGILIIELDVFNDERGFFTERFHQEKYIELELPTNFIQDNHSRSYPKVLRGLHYQTNPTQGKLVGCINGIIQDVAVDIRKSSKTFGEYISVTLSGDNGKLLWIPEGFAHGFCVIGNKPADVVYKVNNLYNAAGDKGIIWSDPDINIDWQIKDPILSKKDQLLPMLIQQ